MGRSTRWWAAVVMTGLLALPVSPAAGAEGVGTSFPEDFPEIVDASLGVPVIGFGAAGPVSRVPVILLHGNNDTPFPTDCNGAFGKIHGLARYLHEQGYATSELWGLGYQGDQCDLVTSPPNRSGEAHSTVANVPDLRAFVDAVLTYTGASRVDIVGHSLGASLPREWMRQDDAYDRVRRLVSVDGPHHGIINCSPDPRNYWQAPALGGFDPDSAICREYGAEDTPFLATLNAGDETPGPTEYLAIVNADTSFVFFDEQDGTIPPVPARDRHGDPHDFSDSARLAGAETLELSGQGRHDETLRTAHLGIIDSPETWAATFAFLSAPEEPPASPTPEAATDDGRSAVPPAAGTEPLPATGSGSPAIVAAGALLLLAGVGGRRAARPEPRACSGSSVPSAPRSTGSQRIGNGGPWTRP